MSTTQSSIRSSEAVFRESRPGTVADVCPLCEQTIPADKLVEIQRRERDKAATERKRLRADFEKEMDHAIAQKQKEVEAASEVQLKVAEQSKNKALKQIKALQADQKRTVIQSARREAAAKDTGKKEAEAALARKLAAADEAKQTAEQKLTVQASEYKKQLQQQRESLQKANQQSLAKKDSAYFRESKKHLKTIQQLTRRLEQKTANERGEGAEIDLYYALCDAFEADKIKRIRKGEPGADIWHDVKQNGQVCGRIVYDSKDHLQWRASFVKKLRDDQLAADANHAVLALAPPAFPTHSSQLDIREGVIIANPARVVTIVSILREHIIQTHRLRMSEEERDEKMALLYDFITSDRCNQIFDQFNSLMAALDALEVAEQKAHNKTWADRGRLMKKVIKVIQGQLHLEIDRILHQGSTT